MTNKQTNKTVAFLVGVLLLGIFGCENQISVDSLNENAEVPELRAENGMNDILQERSNFKTSPLTSSDGLSDEMKELIESRGLDPDQIQQFSISEKKHWKAGEVSSNVSKKEKETEAGLLYLIDPCFEDDFGDDLDCEGYPAPPPAPTGPIPPLTIYVALDSFVSPSQYTGYVQMGSWSSTSQPIDFIGVVGSSYRDLISIGGYSNGGANRHAAAVIITAPKPGFPLSAEMLWEQFGQHYFEHGGGQAVGYTSDSEHF